MLVTARKLTDLEVADGELPAPAPGRARRRARIAAPELVASAADALVALHEPDARPDRRTPRRRPDPRG